MTLPEEHSLPNTVDELEVLLLAKGVDVTAPNVQENLQKRLAAVENNSSGARRPESYIKRRNNALAMRDSGALFMHSFFASVLPPLGLAGLILAEILSVFFGFSVFIKEPNPFAESLIQWSLSFSIIFTYLVFEWVYADAKHKYTNDKKIKVKFNLWYIFNWIKSNFVRHEYDENESSLLSYNLIRNILIVSIVVIGTLGRLGTTLEGIPNGSYLDQITYIFTQSTLVQMAGYVGAALVTISLLLGTSFIMRYQYQVYVKAVGVTEVNFFDLGDLNAQKDEITMKYYRSLYIKALMQEKKKEQIQKS